MNRCETTKPAQRIGCVRQQDIHARTARESARKSAKGARRSRPAGRASCGRGNRLPPHAHLALDKTKQPSRPRPSYHKQNPTQGIYNIMSVSLIRSFVLICLSTTCLLSAPAANRFREIFDGTSLKGWQGDPRLWSVQDGAIVGQTSDADPIDKNSFLIWRQGVVDDFELKFDYKINAGNSGVQYRAFEKPKEWGPFVMGGLQADFEAGEQHTGGLYSERSRRILAKRGQKTEIGADHKPVVVGTLGDPVALQSHINSDDWNSFHVIARGNRYIHKINGHVMVDVTDNDPSAPRSGLIGLQVHRGPAMRVEFRNLTLKRLAMAGKKKVVLLGGQKSHGYGAHEHNAGVDLLAAALNKNHPGIHAVSYHDGNPADPTALDNADAVIVYADGGLRHPWHSYVRNIDAAARRRVGVGALHFGVEVPTGDLGQKFFDWIGGHYERWWSVNPHWNLEQPELAENHPITNGVKPFTVNDEWYFNIRFRPGMQGISPILTATPPLSTMSRPDGPHSGNPYVREMTKRGERQTLAWASENTNGARGFGFTGGHNHWNWGHPDFRKLVLNAAAWIAGAEVPDNGIESGPYSLEDLQAGQDYPPWGKYKKAEIEKNLRDWQ